MAPPPATDPHTLLNAANAALNRLEAANPGLYKSLTDAYIKSGLKNSASVQTQLNRLPAGSDKTALQHFFASPAALALAITEAIGSSVQGVGKVIAKGGGIVGGLPQNVGNAAGKGLEANVEPLAGIAGILSTLTSPNTWLRVGEGILGLLLLTVGVVAITKSTPVGKAVTNTAGKVAKYIP
jgi:hypothetical protein